MKTNCIAKWKSDNIEASVIGHQLCDRYIRLENPNKEKSRKTRTKQNNNNENYG